MTDIILTVGQVRDAMRTCALLCDKKYMALGRSGVYYSDDKMQWCGASETWCDEDGDEIERWGLSIKGHDFLKYAEYETTQVEVDLKPGLMYVGEDKRIVIRESSRGAYDHVHLAEVKDMLEVFAILCDYKHAGLAHSGIAYLDEPMVRPDYEWRGPRNVFAYYYSLDAMDVSMIPRAELLATQVTVDRYAWVKYSPDGEPDTGHTTIRKDGVGPDGAGL